MQLSLFDDHGKEFMNTQVTSSTGKPSKRGIVSLATNNNLAEFLTDDGIDIKKAWVRGYVDEIKGLLLTWLINLPKYKKARDHYKTEIKNCVAVLQLYYFTIDDVKSIDNLCNKIQIELRRNGNTFNNQAKNDHISSLFKEYPDILGSTGYKVDKHREELIMHIYNSYINSKKVDIKEKCIRYNRLFFKHQLEYKPMYNPNGRSAENRQHVSQIVKQLKS